MFFSFALPTVNVGENLITSLFLPFAIGFFPFNFLKLNLLLSLVLVEDKEVPVDAFLEYAVFFFDELVDEDVATPLLLVLSHLLDLVYSELERCFSLNFLLLFPVFVVDVVFFFFLLLLVDLEFS